MAAAERLARKTGLNDGQQSAAPTWPDSSRSLPPPATLGTTEAADRQNAVLPTPEQFASAAANLSGQSPTDEVSLQAVLSFFNNPGHRQLLMQASNCLAWNLTKKTGRLLAEPSRFPSADQANAIRRYQAALQARLTPKNRQSSPSPEATVTLQTTADLCQMLGHLVLLDLPNDLPSDGHVLTAADLDRVPTGIGATLWEVAANCQLAKEGLDHDPNAHYLFWGSYQLPDRPKSLTNAARHRSFFG